MWVFIVIVIILIIILIATLILMKTKSRNDNGSDNQNDNQSENQLEKTKNKLSDKADIILFSVIDDGEIYLYLPNDQYLLIDSKNNIDYIGSFTFNPDSQKINGDYQKYIGNYNMKFPSQYIQDNKLLNYTLYSGMMLNLLVQPYDTDIVAFSGSVDENTPVLHQGEAFTLNQLKS